MAGSGQTVDHGQIGDMVATRGGTPPVRGPVLHVAGQHASLLMVTAARRGANVRFTRYPRTAKVGISQTVSPDSLTTDQ